MIIGLLDLYPHTHIFVNVNFHFWLPPNIFFGSERVERENKFFPWREIKKKKVNYIAVSLSLS
jgi:hypothetical protein